MKVSSLEKLRLVTMVEPLTLSSSTFPTAQQALINIIRLVRLSKLVRALMILVSQVPRASWAWSKTRLLNYSRRTKSISLVILLLTASIATSIVMLSKGLVEGPLLIRLLHYLPKSNSINASLSPALPEPNIADTLRTITLHRSP